MKKKAIEEFDLIRSSTRRKLNKASRNSIVLFNFLLKILILNSVLQSCFGQTIVRLLAGNGYTGSAGSGGDATAAYINNPKGIWSDSLGGVYIAEKSNGCIRKVTTSNILIDFAGQCAVTSSTATDGGPATSTKFSNPVCVVGDTTGIVYIGDQASSRIRSVTSGIMGWVGGVQSASVNSGDGGKATAAGINDPTGLAYSTTGLLYVVTTTDNQLRVISLSAGLINLVAGTVYGFHSLISLLTCWLRS